MRTLICASVSALAICSFSHAGFVDVAFTGTGKGQNVKIVSPGHNGNVFAGQLNFALSNSTAGDFLNGNWIGFCTDLYQTVSAGTNQYEVLPISALPMGAPMGAAKAAAIQSIYSFAAGAQLSSGTTNAFAAAFQLAIWEIVTDYTGVGPSLGLNITSGLFSATKTDGDPLSATIMGHLASLFGAIGTSGDANLIGIGSSNRQDQILEISNVIPGPGALATAAIGVLLSGARRRRS